MMNPQSICLTALCFGALLLSIAESTIFARTCSASSNKATAESCYCLYKSFELDLVNNTANLYRLRKAFIPYQHAIIDINYNISFQGWKGCTRNLTTGLDCNPAYIWSSSAVYTVLPPSFLSLMQFQLPFSILRLIRLILNYADHSEGPEVTVFLWDGSYSLPSMFVDLNVPSPTELQEFLFTDVLRDFTSMLRAYAISEKNLSSWDEISAGYILDREAFLPSSQSLKGNIRSAAWLQIITVVFLCWYGHMLYFALYKITASVIPRMAKTREEKRLLVGIVRAGVLLTIPTVICEAVQTIIWWKYSQIVGALMFAGKLFPTVVLPGLAVPIYACYDGQTAKTATVTIACYIFGLVIFICSFPTFLLLLVYPIKVFAVVSYMVIFIFFLVIAMSVDVTTAVVGVFLPFFYPILVLLYATIIVKDSAISADGTQAVIFLLPSIILSLAAFFVKKIVLGEESSEPDSDVSQQTEQPTQPRALTNNVPVNEPASAGSMRMLPLATANARQCTATEVHLKTGQTESHLGSSHTDEYSRLLVKQPRKYDTLSM